MRYAIISDIHSNRQALNVVLTDIKSIGVDSIVCLGDVVGYGPSPVESLERVHAEVDSFCLGNHDAVVAGKLSSENFNDNAKQLIEWTCSKLDGTASEFFSAQPLILHGKNIICSHANFSCPGSYAYVFEEPDALQEFSSCSEQMLFIGHSHVAGIFVIGRSGTPHCLSPVDFRVEKGKRYIINVGSVGCPRDDDIRASYCIFDQKKGDLIFRRIPFDMDAYRQDLKSSGLSEKTSSLVEFYTTGKGRPIRETVAFRAVSPEKAVKVLKDTRYLEEEVSHLNKIKAILLVVIIILMLVAAVSGYSYLKAEKAKRQLAMALNSSPVLAMTVLKNESDLKPIENPVPDQELIQAPAIVGEISDGNVPGKWFFELSDPQKQKVFTEKFSDKKYENIPVFRMKSGDNGTMLIKYCPVSVKKDMRFTASAQFKKISLESGDVALQLVLEKNDGTSVLIAHNIPSEIRENDKWTIKTSVTLSKKDIHEDGNLFFCIRGNFVGEILVRNCSLKRK